MTLLVLLRHGESEWNQQGRFAGWVDIPLTELGIAQARHAGRFMHEGGTEFDVCHTSVLKRATHTAWHCLDSMDRTWLPTHRSWQLNERHYGALHGLRKTDIANGFGEDQLQLWRRSFATRPPTLPNAPPPAPDHRYAGVRIPASESLEDTIARITPLWNHDLAPALASGARTLVVAHGTSLRALLYLVCGYSRTEIVRVEVPNGIPLVVNFVPGMSGLRPHRLYDQTMDLVGLRRRIIR